MELTIEIITNFVQHFIWTWFITSFFGFKENNKHTAAAFIGVWLLSVAEITFINYIVVYDGFLSVIQVLTFIVYARFNLKGNRYMHIFITLFSIALIFTIGSVIIFFFSYLFGKSTESLIADFTILRILIIVVSRFFEFMAFKVILSIKDEYSLTKKEWGLFIAMPLLTWVMVTLMTKVTIQSPETIFYCFYVVLIIVFIDIIIYYFMIKIKQDANAKTELELVKLQYNDIKKTEMNMKALYDNIYSVKHDIEKHMLAVKAMAEKNQNKEIASYINNVYNASIKNVQKIMFSDNDIFNAVVNMRLGVCKQKEINPSINIFNEAINFIKSEHIVVLFGNLFDNAIEAAEHSDERLIILNIQLQGEYISIYMENSFDKNYSNVNLKTNKENKREHGFGMKNVQKIVSDCDGMIQCFENGNNMFCCDILLKKQ